MQDVTPVITVTAVVHRAQAAEAEPRQDAEGTEDR